MSSSSAELRQFVARVLVDPTDAVSPDPSDIAESFNTLCDQLRTRLQPLFGIPVTNALFARALDLSAAEFPWLYTAIARGSDRCSMEGLALAASTVPLTDLRDALAAVLARDIELLGDLVGIDLILPLVLEAWAQPAVRAAGTDDGAE